MCRMVVLVVILFSLVTPTVSPAGKLMSQWEANQIVKQNNLEGQVITVFEHCGHLYSKEEIREALAFTYTKFPPSLQARVVEFVQRATDVAAAEEVPLDATVCRRISVILHEPLRCP
jgi:hypothetical protein